VTETRTLDDTDIPLLERISLGPLEDDAKIFIVEVQRKCDITEEVVQNISLCVIFNIIPSFPAFFSSITGFFFLSCFLLSFHLYFFV